MEKSILIIGATSEIAQNVIRELKNNNWKIYATSRQTGIMDEKVQEFNLDVTKEMDFILLKDKIANLKFDVILNFAGIAIAGAVEELSEIELKKQLDVNVFGLLRIIKYIVPYLSEGGRLINTSSMASYGVFPFLSPYCMSKASADILLNSYSMESGIKTVSIRPGVIATKFWDASIELNKAAFSAENEKFKQEKEFLIKNANRNSLHGTSPIYVAKKIAQIVELKNPKNVYNIGLDSKIAKFSRFIPQKILNNLICFIFKKRVSKKN